MKINQIGGNGSIQIIGDGDVVVNSNRGFIDIGGKRHNLKDYTDQYNITIEVVGDVRDIDTTGNVNITGNCRDIDTTGNITIGGNVEGDIDCVGNIKIGR